MLKEAANHATLKNCGSATPISGPGIDIQFDVGTYTIVWEVDGKHYNQTVTIV